MNMKDQLTNMITQQLAISWLNDKLEKDFDKHEDTLKLLTKTFTEPILDYIQHQVKETTVIFALCNAIIATVDSYREAAIDCIAEQFKDDGEGQFK